MSASATQNLIVGIAIGVIVTAFGVLLQNLVTEHWERRKRRLDLVYGPLYGAVTEIRKNIPPHVDLNKLSGEFYVDATEQYRIMQEVFARWPHLIENSKVIEGWQKIRIESVFGGSQSVRMYMNQDTGLWFKEIETEYCRLIRRQLTPRTVSH